MTWDEARKLMNEGAKVTCSGMNGWVFMAKDREGFMDLIFHDNRHDQDVIVPGYFCLYWFDDWTVVGEENHESA